jgi:hypothetical protein
MKRLGGGGGARGAGRRPALRLRLPGRIAPPAVGNIPDFEDEDAAVPLILLRRNGGGPLPRSANATPSANQLYLFEHLSRKRQCGQQLRRVKLALHQSAPLGTTFAPDKARGKVAPLNTTAKTLNTFPVARHGPAPHRRAKHRLRHSPRPGLGRVEDLRQGHRSRRHRPLVPSTAQPGGSPARIGAGAETAGVTDHGRPRSHYTTGNRRQPGFNPGAPEKGQSRQGTRTTPRAVAGFAFPVPM